MKESTNELGLQIRNCVWDGLSEATWFTEEKKYTLDHVCMDGRNHRKYVNTCVHDRGEVIESDNVGIRVQIE